MSYEYIAAFGFVVIIFLTLRDIRIYHRTRIESYRKGALRGMIAGALALVGMGVTAENPSIGLTITLVAVYINGKGRREDVFGDAPLIKRVLGETMVKKDVKTPSTNDKTQIKYTYQNFREKHKDGLKVRTKHGLLVRSKKIGIAIISAAIMYFGFVATEDELSFTGANIFTAIVVISFWSIFTYAGVSTVDKFAKSGKEKK